MICVDTSFLISLYGTDVNTPAARQLLAAAVEPLAIHTFNDFEFTTAIKLLVFRGKITSIQGQAWAANYKADKQAGTLVLASLDANAVLRRSAAISEARCETSGDRCFDILLAAAAVTLGAAEFWSFDARQRALASAEGLMVRP